MRCFRVEIFDETADKRYGYTQTQSEGHIDENVPEDVRDLFNIAFSDFAEDFDGREGLYRLFIGLGLV